MHSGEIEVAVARYLGIREHLIVPNISWGLGFDHELDLLLVTQCNYAWEIEIKISKSDLKQDLQKRHRHYSNKIKRLYFAVPNFLKNEALKLIPERAGLFIVTKNRQVELIKAPRINLKAQPLDEKEIAHLYHLISMRIWTLKERLYNLQKSKLKVA